MSSKSSPNKMSISSNTTSADTTVADADSNFITKLPGVTIKSYDFFGTYVGLEAAKKAIDQGLIGTIKIS